jgi:hypothetical protein
MSNNWRLTSFLIQLYNDRGMRTRFEDSPEVVMDAARLSAGRQHRSRASVRQGAGKTEPGRACRHNDPCHCGIAGGNPHRPDRICAGV